MSESAPRVAFAEERQRRIAHRVTSRGRATVTELAVLLDVTEQTIRRDLSELEERSRLKRVHGGAIPVEPLHEPAPASREAHNVAGKEAIAAACLEEVRQGSSLFLDSGSTVLRIAERLEPFHVDLLTNSIRVAEAVVDFPSVRHTVLGGQLRRTNDCFIGPLALEALRQFTVNVAFIGASGIAADGITDSDFGETQLKAAVIGRARKVVVPIDHTKVGSMHFSLIAPLDDIDLVVTDAHDEELSAVCREHGVELRVATPLHAVPLADAPAQGS